MMKNAMRALGALALGVLMLAPTHGANANEGRNLAAACANCHGTDGRSQGGMPSLAGQDRDYMLQQLKDFKAGKRPATIMHQLAKGYTDEQLGLISNYLAGQKRDAPRSGY